MLKETQLGLILSIKVIPRAYRDEIIGWENRELKVKISAFPQKGNANEALIRILSKKLHLSRSSLTLIYGFTSRHKRVCITGMTLDQAARLLELNE